MNGVMQHGEGSREAGEVAGLLMPQLGAGEAMIGSGIAISMIAC